MFASNRMRSYQVFGEHLLYAPKSSNWDFAMFVIAQIWRPVAVYVEP